MDEMTTPTPSLTVIIPTYNWSSVLPYSIGSALLQTFTDFELLVVGDGCTDDSEAVVEAVGDPRVRWVNLPSNTGHQSGPNNEGLRQARGELIAYLGHDDLWLPHHLSCMVDALARGADLAYAVTEMVRPQGDRPKHATLRQSYRPGMWLPPSCVVHRRSLTESVGGWRDYQELSVDPEVDLWQRAHDAGYRLTFVPRLTVVKFPASWRRDVYRERPHHEQAAWLKRIGEEENIEAVELTRMLIAAAEARAEAKQEKPYRDLLRMMLRETTRRVRRRLIGRGATPPPPPQGEQIEARRQFKGLGHNP